MRAGVGWSGSLHRNLPIAPIRFGGIHIGLLTLFLIPSEKYGRLFAHPARFSMSIAVPAMLATSTKLGDR